MAGGYFAGLVCWRVVSRAAALRSFSSSLGTETTFRNRPLELAKACSGEASFISNLRVVGICLPLSLLRILFRFCASFASHMPSLSRSLAIKACMVPKRVMPIGFAIFRSAFASLAALCLSSLENGLGKP